MNLPAVFTKRRSNGAALVDDLGFLVNEDAAVYHAQASAFLSSHQLRDFRRNPLLFHRKHSGLISEEDRPAYLIGRAAHVLILEGREAFANQYACGGPVNPKTGEPFGSRTKAFQEWAEEQGKAVLTDEQEALIERMNAAVYGHDNAAALLVSSFATR